MCKLKRQHLETPLGILVLILAIVLATLAGCASSAKPFIDTKLVVQHDSGSDWMLRPERRWIADNNNPRLHVVGGLEWKNGIDCPWIATGTDQLRWINLGCGMTFGRYAPYRKLNLFGEVHIVHQLDQHSSWWLRRERTDWMGHNPRLTLRGGLQWGHKIKCPMIASGTSIFQGAPFESESNAPELYWFNFECSKRWGGQ